MNARPKTSALGCTDPDRTRPLAIALVGLALLEGLPACRAPSIDEYEPHTGIIEGTILYPNGAERGHVVVALFAEDDPPPPKGDGAPVNFVVVPDEALFRGAGRGEARDFAAPFTIPTVPRGRYRIQAFLDADGDFNPTEPLLAQPTAGDIGGGHFDRETGELLSIAVEPDRIIGPITVTLGFVFPYERPCFAITSSVAFSTPFARPLRIALDAHPIDRAEVKADPERTVFAIAFADDDSDGEPDDRNGDHLPDVYPRVLLRRINPRSDDGSIFAFGIIDPLPYLDRLSAIGTATTARVDVIIPSAAIERGTTGDRLISSIPPGTYEVIVIASTGQTWTVPNGLDRVQPNGAPDPTQSQAITLHEGEPLPAGRITGVLDAESVLPGDAYAIVFDAARPPPPTGTGRPIAIASVPRESFEVVGAALEAPFEVGGLPDGSYVVRGLLDVDRDFSPLVDLLAQPTAGDVAGGSSPEILVIAGGGTVDRVRVRLDQTIAFDRPSFEIDAIEVAESSLPLEVELRVHPIAALGMTDESVRFPVALAEGDLDGDNFRDLYPRVLLTRMREGAADPRVTPDEAEPFVIPAIVDPLPHTSALASGIAMIPERTLSVILPPFAFRARPSGDREIVSPPPPGRYRVNVVAPSGQTWFVPSDLDVGLGRVGTLLEDASQARAVRIGLGGSRPQGAISGEVRLFVPPPAGDYQVVVLAFDAARPPPPLGSGRPVTSTVVPRSAFSAASIAPYRLSGLPTGRYEVRAFLDADDDLTPWFDTLNQPDRGDVGGGHVDLPAGTLAEVVVDALGGPSNAIDVSIIAPLTFRTDRPVFALEPEEPVLDPSSGPLSVVLRAISETSDVITQDGVFPVQWVDLDHDGLADDRSGDGQPDVFPLVVAELLDVGDERGLTPSASSIRILGSASPTQFVSLGFPASDPGRIDAVVEARSMNVVFPPWALDGAGRQVPPPDGRYRVTVVNAAGQTWSVPNELVRALDRGAPISRGHAGGLRVRD